MADQIRDKGVVQTPPTVVHPLFFFPPGVIDLTRGKESDTADYSGDENIDVMVDADDIDQTEATGTAEDPNYLMAPWHFEVISQTVRFGPDGLARVDVVIELVDVPGAIDYKVRLTR